MGQPCGGARATRLRATSESGDAGIERCAGKPERGPGRLISGLLALSWRGAPYLPWPAVGRATIGLRSLGSVPVRRPSKGSVVGLLGSGRTSRWPGVLSMLQDLVALGGHHCSVSLCSYLFGHAQERSQGAHWSGPGVPAGGASVALEAVVGPVCS